MFVNFYTVLGNEALNTQVLIYFQIATQYAQTVLHTITNPDGSVSIVQVDPNNPIITLPDGTTAHVQGMATVINNYHFILQICLIRLF